MTQDHVKLDPGSCESVRAWLTHALAGVLYLDSKAIDAGATFAEFGLDSASAYQFIEQIERKFARSLDIGVFVSYPTIDALAQHLVGATVPNTR